MPVEPPDHHEPQRGLHPVEWSCELIGTALLLFGGLSAICLDFGPHAAIAAHVPSHSTRLLITGLLFAAAGSLVAISPLGRRSGAHLNPAVTLAFWLRGNVHRHDLLGYTASQIAGAVLGTLAVEGLWGHTARVLSFGATVPGHGLDNVQAAGVETLMTAALVLAILLMTSRAGTAPWTPLVVWIVVAALVWQGAAYTGTSLNPARSFGPAILGHRLAVYWIYVAGPLAGAALAAGLHEVLPGGRPVTAKLFHDPAYRSSLGGSLPVKGSELAQASTK
ncbi:MAG TPA: aquaporin [Mycobacteriales bacterium]|jgi:aquaporin Z|nr:aquaporin [Mycobacteriales bacterium]